MRPLRPVGHLARRYVDSRARRDDVGRGVYAAGDHHRRRTPLAQIDSVARINYVELPARDLGAARTFYATVFGWDLTNFGPSYSSTTTGTVDLGLQGDMSEATSMPLAVVLVEDIDAAQRSVIDAGGTISRAVFAFPGGRRFHFRDPNGVELAIMQAE